jgi:hypothetical protein
VISARPKRRTKPKRSPETSVFINCPFDDGYKPLFEAVVFTVIDCGLHARCFLEIDDGSEVRFEKIIRIIGECRFGVHDISRTELDGANGLPRFNMPLELGLFLGAKRFGGGVQLTKTCLILDVETYRFQKFISDIAGQDIRAHGREIGRAISAVRDWLRTSTGSVSLPGGKDIHARFEIFKLEAPAICARMRLAEDELTFADYYAIAATWLDERLADPSVGAGPL